MDTFDAVRAVHLIKHIARLAAATARVRRDGEPKRGRVQMGSLGLSKGVSCANS